MIKTPVAIVGGGPGGSSLSMFLAQKGIQSVIVEREAFPRYHIGESMTGEAGGLLRALGLEQEMLKRRYPIKQGVMVYGPEARTKWYVPVMRRNEKQELEPVHTWQVRRSNFDKMMLEEASARGAILVHGQATVPLINEDGSARGVRVKLADGGMQDIECEVLVDATGLASWLAHTGVASQKRLGKYDKQVAVFSQVVGARRDGGKVPGDTIILYKEHLHWAWFIPIDDEVVSVGVVSPATYFQSKKESKRDFILRELQELNPELNRLIPQVKLVEEARAIPNYSYQVNQYTGKGWLCVGDCHRFVDPIFSFGMYISLREAQFAAQAIQEYLEGQHRDDANPFAGHQRLVDNGMDKFESLIDAFWANPLAFAWMVHQKYTSDIIDLFAGRVYDDRVSPGLAALRGVVQYEGTRPKCPTCGVRLESWDSVCGCGGTYSRQHDSSLTMAESTFATS